MKLSLKDFEKFTSDEYRRTNNPMMKIHKPLVLTDKSGKVTATPTKDCNTCGLWRAMIKPEKGVRVPPGDSGNALGRVVIVTPINRLLESGELSQPGIRRGGKDD